MLPHLQKDNQRHHQNLPERVGFVLPARDLVTFKRRGCQSHEFIQQKYLFMCLAQVQQDSHSKTFYLRCFVVICKKKPKASSHFLKGNKILYSPLQDRKINFIY